jgi:hypothetical protein
MKLSCINIAFMKYYSYFLAFLASIVVSCASADPVIERYTEVPEDSAECYDPSRLSPEELAKADLLIYSSLQNEALHSFISDLKPMSDIASFRFYLQKSDTLDTSPSQIAGTAEFVEKYESLGRIAATVSCGTVSAALFPFRNTHNGQRYMQFRVINSYGVKRVLSQYPEFWNQWAFNRYTPPKLIIQIMEYEESLDRFRGYGYLYGYPSHAVDFFVDAAASQQQTGDFVERDFLQMPVVSEQQGRFVYAVEKGHSHNSADLHIQELAHQNVAFYRQVADDYYREDGTFDSFRFLRDHYSSKRAVE